MCVIIHHMNKVGKLVSSQTNVNTSGITKISEQGPLFVHLIQENLNHLLKSIKTKLIINTGVMCGAPPPKIITKKPNANFYLSKEISASPDNEFQRLQR